jgi:hypothetical protein
VLGQLIVAEELRLLGVALLRSAAVLHVLERRDFEPV